MVHRQSFKQLIICFGLLNLIGNNTALSAPLCSQVLINAPEVVINEMSVLDELAGLKLQLDQARAQGGMSMLLKSFEAEFNKRFDEIYSQMSTRMSESEFKEMIRLKILKKQNREEELIQERAEQKQAMRGLLPILGFETELHDVNMYPVGMSYLANRDALLVSDYHGRHLYDLKSKESKRVAQYALTHIGTDGDQVFFLDKRNGDLWSEDLNSGAVKVVVPKARRHLEVQEYGEAQFSSNARWFAVLNELGTGFQLSNTQTGEKKSLGIIKKPNFFKRHFSKYSHEYITRFTFLDDAQVLATSSEGRTLIMNVETGKKAPVEIPQEINFQTASSRASNGNLILWNGHVLALAKISDLIAGKTSFKTVKLSQKITEAAILSDSMMVIRVDDNGRGVLFMLTMDNMSLYAEPFIQGSSGFHYGDGMAIDPSGLRLFLGGSYSGAPGQGKAGDFIQIFKGK